MVNDADDKIRFGEKVKLIRKYLKFTQIEFAKELGYSSTGRICQIEHGAGMSQKKIWKFYELADRYGIPRHMVEGERKYTEEQFERILAYEKLERENSDHPLMPAIRNLIKQVQSE